MNASARLAAYGMILGLALGGGAVVGAAVGPIEVGSDDHGQTAASDSRDLPAGGLLIADDGYRLVPESRTLDPGRFVLAVLGPDGDRLVDYELLHQRELHLIVASRDLRSYVHLHPERVRDGRWQVTVPDLAPGAYRAFADFRPGGGEQITLGVDMWVPGTPSFEGPLSPVDAVPVDDLEVAMVLDAGTATLTVRRGTEIVTTEPYLGAAGHLVALRDGDLAYLHVHPLDSEPAGPVRFALDVPSAGTYAVFFEFKADGEVRTAPLVFAVDDAGLQPTVPDDDHGEGDH